MNIATVDESGEEWTGQVMQVVVDPINGPAGWGLFSAPHSETGLMVGGLLGFHAYLDSMEVEGFRAGEPDQPPYPAGHRPRIVPTHVVQWSPPP